MGALPRLCSLLETDPTLALEESILSILIAVARASPACSAAISKFQRLVDDVVERLLVQKNPNVLSTRIKSVMLLRVLAQSDQKLCMQFIKDGTFQKVTWQLYSITSSIDGWVKSGREHCKLASKLMIEQLRLWRVCINYGHCVSYFTAFFPALCLWLNLPRLELLVEKNLIHEFCSISSEAYLVLEALSKRLPNLYTQQRTMNHSQDTCDDGGETWCWNDVSPMVDLALTWIAFSRDSSLSKAFDLQTGTDGKSFVGDHMNSLLWVVSAVLRFLSTIVIKALPNDSLDNGESVGIRKPLPQFVSKISYQIVKNGLLSFSHGGIEKLSIKANGVSSFVDKLCYLRNLSNHGTALASVCCLHEVFQLLVAIDRSTQLSSENEDQHFSSRSSNSSVAGGIINDGIMKCSFPQRKAVLLQCMNLVVTEWQSLQSIEVFGRGGPAPGVGLGWGASGGGFWSLTVSLAQADASFLIDLLQTISDSSWDEILGESERNVCKQMIISALAVCLIAGPNDASIVKKAFDFLLQIRVLKYFNLTICQFLQDSPRFKQLNLEYGEEDLLIFSKLLASHYSIRWLFVKPRKRKETADGIPMRKTFQKNSGSLDTILEDMDVDSVAVTRVAPASLAAEWAHQRLPLPKHWLLSPLTTLGQSKDGSSVSTSGKSLAAHDSAEVLEVIKAGLFFLLGIEILSAFMSGENLFVVHSPVTSIPLVWKLHSLSVMLLSGMSVLEDERNRGTYEALQFLYGRQLDESRLNNSNDMDLLRFQSEIHETYTTLFIDALVEQFASESFGNLHYGRQIAIYLHRLVEFPVRLAMWNALSNSRVLELMPLLDKCVGDAVGYLEPAEEEDDILQAYAKSWASGALDKAMTRGSMSYALALHHLSSFIFNVSSEERRPSRNKIVKSLLRDYSRKQQRQAMMIGLIRYRADSTLQQLRQNECMHSDNDELNRRLEILAESCDRDSSLLNEVEKLKSLLQPKMS
ncbi:Transcriptional elongation regulator MINIYO-like protein [Drosera capensis]